MLPRLFIVDGNYYLHRLFHTVGSKSSSRTFADAFVAKVCREAQALKAGFLVVAFDGDAVFRYDIYADYKGQRGDNDEVYAHLPAVLARFKAANIQVVQSKKHEADDLMCSYAHQLHDTHMMYMGVRDKDAYQYLLWDSVVLYDTSHKVGKTYIPLKITQADVVEKTGLLPNQQTRYQALIGDSVDNIPRLLGPATARKGLQTHRTIADWCAYDAAIAAKLRPSMKQLKLNHQLVTLVKDIKLPALQRVTKSEDSSLPRAYWDYINFLYPKTKGLFK